jgi:hypothetical protein
VSGVNGGKIIIYKIYILIRIGTKVVVEWVSIFDSYVASSRFESGLGNLTDAIYLTFRFGLF